MRDTYYHEIRSLRFELGEDGILYGIIERGTENLIDPGKDAMIEDRIVFLPGSYEKIDVHGINELIEYAKERK